MSDALNNAIQDILHGAAPVAWLHDPETGELVGAETCQPDPLETEQQGETVWLIPGHATLVEPPAAQAGFARVWDGQQWQQVEDHRGQDYWLPGSTWETPGTPVRELGPLPEGAVTERPEQPAPTPEEQQAALQAKFTNAIQQRLDAFARTRGYDNIMSACTYVNSVMERFRLEGERAARLRDETWITAYAILDAVLAGEREVPTLEELFSELPELTWEEA